MNAKPETERDAFVADLIANHFTTYFVATHHKYAKSNPAFRFTEAPVSVAIPYGWKYGEARKRLMQLSSLLTAEEAERRNINFVNPNLQNFMPGAALPTLRGGIQLLLPGEKAYAHRHSANAFRLVFEADTAGGYTTVEGTRVPMCPGDLICTPNWTWHDHHNEGNSHVIWYDGLDVLMAFWIGAVFYEEMKDVTGSDYQAVEREATETTDVFGPGLRHSRQLFPEHIPLSNNSLVYYPYAKAREMLEALATSSPGDPREGIVVEYVNPLTSGPTFPTMATSVRRLPPGESLAPIRRTENVIYVTMEGSVTIRLDDGTAFNTEPFDVTAIPSWVPYSFENTGHEAAIVFAQSDRPVFEKFGLYRDTAAG